MMNYKKIVPSDSFIGRYLDYMSNIETPESYDFWCAMWALGVRVGKGMYVNRPHSPVFCNWYIILAAESGTTRKSTAVNTIARVVSDLSVSNPHSIITGKTSPEALEILLHEQTRDCGKAVASFAAPELATVLGREGYMSTMPALLTDLYECPEFRTNPGTLRSGMITQRDVYINFLSASTPAWLVTSINPTVIEGGFTSRVMFVVENDRKKSVAWPSPRHIKDLMEIRDAFDILGKYNKPIEISSGALKKYTTWYNKRTKPSDPYMSSFEAREDDHVLRTACCLCINDGILEIQTKHITNAIAVIQNVKEGAYKLFGGTFSESSRISDAVTKVREVLMEVGADGIKHTSLLRRVQTRINSRELKVLIKILHESGMIQMFELTRGGKIYRATRAIEKFGIVTDVLKKMNV